MNKILVVHGERKELAKLLNTSEVTVRKALNDRSKSELAQRIRALAIERGGVEVKTTDAN